MQIHKVNRAVLDFLTEMFDGQTRILGIAKLSDTQWKATCEVFEESAFIKSIGLKTNVMDRHIYELLLNDSLEVISYTRQHTENS